VDALSLNTVGVQNTAVGASALLNNTADGNTAIGFSALSGNTTGIFNTANGWEALFVNTTGSYNTAIGHGALYFNTIGAANTATGAGALQYNNGDFNTATGSAALLVNTTGANNTAVGGGALQNNNADFNTATGELALASNTTGASNNAFGDHALNANTSGALNVAIGSSALVGNVSGSGNIGIGFFGGSNVTTANNVIAIGTAGNNVDNSCYIGQIFGATSSNGIGMFINSNGRLGTATSSRRFKDDIKPMGKASEALYALQPVTFRYKKNIDPEGSNAAQFGLVAEDAEKVNPDLVVRDKEGKPYSVRYDQVNAMLLNEFLKEHRKVQKLEATVADLASQLRRVSATMEVTHSAAQLTVSNR